MWLRVKRIRYKGFLLLCDRNLNMCASMVNRNLWCKDKEYDIYMIGTCVTIHVYFWSIRIYSRVREGIYFKFYGTTCIFLLRRTNILEYRRTVLVPNCDEVFGFYVIACKERETSGMKIMRWFSCFYPYTHCWWSNNK